ncbi:MAG TPA: hypothetical protein VNX40_09060 [Mucilaginibacter sp.]|jgi:hypothetical protein|nr:hypothetical protein [Mucilaginibacter sp.]
MNNIFNLNRFGRLFVKHTVENYKSYLMSVTVLIGVMILGGSFLIYMIEAPMDRGLQTAVFSMILLLAGTIFTSTIFSGYGDKKKAVSLLTLPASHFEKFLVAWVYSFLLFVIVYTIGFFLVDSLLINIKHFPGHTDEAINFFRTPIVQMYIVYALLHSIAFYGAIFYEKLHFIKTAFVFFISFGLLIATNKFLLSAFIPKTIDMSVPYGNLRIQSDQQTFEISISQQDYYMIWIITVLALVFWTAAYYRLKEKQV